MCILIHMCAHMRPEGDEGLTASRQPRRTLTQESLEREKQVRDHRPRASARGRENEKDREGERENSLLPRRAQRIFPRSVKWLNARAQLGAIFDFMARKMCINSDESEEWEEPGVIKFYLEAKWDCKIL